MRQRRQAVLPFAFERGGVAEVAHVEGEPRAQTRLLHRGNGCVELAPHVRERGDAAERHFEAGEAGAGKNLVRTGMAHQWPHRRAQPAVERIVLGEPAQQAHAGMTMATDETGQDRLAACLDQASCGGAATDRVVRADVHDGIAAHRDRA